VAVPLKTALAPVNFVKDVASGRNVVDSFVDSLPLVIAAKTIMQVIEGGRVLILDANPDRGLLGTSWDLGQALGCITGRFDHVIRATSWNHVAEELLKIGSQKKIKEVQYWGHGNNGAYYGKISSYLTNIIINLFYVYSCILGVAFIGKEAFSITTLQNSLWQRIPANKIFADNALWWWRTCSTCRGDDGRSFSTSFVNTFGIRMAGHTQNIHAIQGGLVMLRPGQIPTWYDNSGDWCVATDMGHHLMGN